MTNVSGLKYSEDHMGPFIRTKQGEYEIQVCEGECITGDNYQSHQQIFIERANQAIQNQSVAYIIEESVGFKCPLCNKHKVKQYANAFRYHINQETFEEMRLHQNYIAAGVYQVTK